MAVRSATPEVETCKLVAGRMGRSGPVGCSGQWPSGPVCQRGVAPYHTPPCLASKGMPRHSRQQRGHRLNTVLTLRIVMRVHQGSQQRDAVAHERRCAPLRALPGCTLQCTAAKGWLRQTLACLCRGSSAAARGRARAWPLAQRAANCIPCPVQRCQASACSQAGHVHANRQAGKQAGSQLVRWQTGMPAGTQHSGTHFAGRRALGQHRWYDSFNAALLQKDEAVGLRQVGS